MMIDQKTLKYLSARAQSLCGNVLVRGANGLESQPMAAHVSKFFNDLAEAHTPAGMQARKDFIAAQERAGTLKQSLAAIRTETFNNFILANNNIWDFFFETINLKPDERPSETNTTGKEVRVYTVAGDGAPSSVLIERNDEENLKALDYLSTDFARYKEMDIYRGQVADAATALINLAYDWRNQAEGRLFALLNTAAFGNFVLTGRKEKRSFVLNSRINAANLPTTNDIDITSNNSSSPFGFSVLDKVIAYYGRFAGSSPVMADAKPTGRILVPGKDIEQIKGSLKAVGAKPAMQGEKLLDDGWFGIHYLGKDWLFIPDNTLAPGTCYPEPSIKPGRVYLKPSMDKTVDRPVGAEENNERERRESKVFGASFNEANRRLICRVSYDVIAD